MNIEIWPLERIVPYASNPRKNFNAIDKVAASLKEFGWKQPMVVDAEGVLVVGHTRREGALRLGWTEGPVVVARDLTPTQIKAYRLADNRTNEEAEWDNELLALELDALKLDGFALDLTGFDDLEIKELLDAGDDEAAGADAGAAKKPKTLKLTERFLVPPFSVLDARQGYWQDRKKEWIGLGIRSEAGRGEAPSANEDGVVKTTGGLLMRSLSSHPDYYNQKRKAEEKVGRALTPTEFERDHFVMPENDALASGTSVFDPVLCELAYRWFSPKGGTVVDPFAGGSVRGIVASKLGRQYIGVDLRAEQVEANRAQAEALCAPGTATVEINERAPDFTPELTPVEQHGEYFAKREDLWTRSGASGAKSRLMFKLAEERNAAGIITAGARISPQIERAALVARALGIPARLHTAEGKPTPEIQTCRDAGATVLQHQAGRLSVIKARLREDSEAHPDWLTVPFGVGLEEYAEDVAAQVANIPADVKRIVVPCGSGMSLAGILRGLERARIACDVLAVRLGHDPADYLEKFTTAAMRARVTFADAVQGFDEHSPVTEWQGIELDPMYEAKCIPFLAPGDCLWCVGIRESSKPGVRTIAADDVLYPVWVAGDSRHIDQHAAGVEADLVFSCPPYADLEVYSDDPQDISNLSYEEFRSAYREIIAKSCSLLKQDRFACFVVGDVRDKRGNYYNFVSDTIQAFLDAGLSLYNEAVLLTSVGSVAMRAGRQFEIGRKLGKSHQNVLVFVKGDGKRATEACGAVEVNFPGEQTAEPEALPEAA